MNRNLAITLTLFMTWASGNALAQNDSRIKTPDLLKDAIDPFSIGKERVLFLKAAGVDTELNEDEFNAHQAIIGGFARKYERFANLLKFDKNRNKLIDWFEADAYRRAIRGAVLAEYDADKNNRLTGKERDAANKALAAGKLPRIALVGSKDRPGALIPRPGADGGERGGRPRGQTGEERRQEWEKLQSRLAAKYDRDGNGRINGKEEWAAAGEEVREYYRQREIERFDTNNDGEVSDGERRRGRDRDMQAELWRQNDRNRDGKLDGEEKQAYKNALREGRDRVEHDEENRRVFMARFDRNEDGELDEQERQAIGPYYEEVRKVARESAMKQFDSNGDGELNDAERQAGREAVEKEANEKYDTDGDGKLSFRERTGAVRKDQKDAERLYFLYVTLLEKRER